MKKTIGLLSICATLAMLALPVFANTSYSSASEIQDACSPDGKTALYAEFYKELHGDQTKAYEAAKKYVACPADSGEQTAEQKDDEAKRIAYLKNFMAKWEAAHRKDQLTDLVLNKKDYPAAFEVGKKVFADDPDYLTGYLQLANGGYAAQTTANNSALNGDATAYAKKALQLIASGKAPDKGWTPFESKDDALGWLNYIIASLTKDKSPAEAIPYFIKAASYEGTIKKLPYTYNFLGLAYETGPYAQQAAEYKTKYEGKDETPESKLALENLNQIIDRMVDAYARAVALSGSDSKYAGIKADALKAATEWYKFRHKSEAGLNEMIAGILAKPLPPEPTPLTSLPTPATSTPASGSGTSTTGSTPPGSNTLAPTGTQPKTGTTPVKPPTTTPTTTKAATPPKPKPPLRKAHAGH
jgi:hypothetical protein